MLHGLGDTGLYRIFMRFHVSLGVTVHVPLVEYAYLIDPTMLQGMAGLLWAHNSICLM